MVPFPTNYHSTDNRQPKTENLLWSPFSLTTIQPETDNRQPATGNRQPTIRQPATGNRQPTNRATPDVPKY